jgi:hypothetical protein
MVWNGHPSEWRLLDGCHGRSEWNDAAAALRLRWQSSRPSLEIKALIARMMRPPGVMGRGIRRWKPWKLGVLRRICSRSAA